MQQPTIRTSIIAAAVFMLAACSATRIDVGSQVSVPAQFEQTQAAQGSHNIARWWENWNDPQLTRLIEQGLQANRDVAIARARLIEAQAGSRYAEADKGIAVNAQTTAGGTYSRRSEISGVGSSANSGNILSAGIQASWEPDFFGQKRSNTDAAAAVTLGAAEQVRAAQMLVAADIADHYLNIQAIRRQSQILKQSEQALRRLKTYTEGRFRAGQTRADSILQADSRLNAVQAQQAVLESQAAQHRRAIAVLTGNTPQGFQIEAGSGILNKLPQAPAGTLPSDVLNRRPDLRAARQQVQERAARLASAKADLYPRFDIRFLGQGGRIEIGGDLPTLKGWSSLLSGGISVPLFTNGRIQANIDAADARLKQALLQYDKTLLQSLADVDNSYQANYALANQGKLLQTAAAKAQTQAAATEKMYRYDAKTLDNALTDRLTALDYQQQLVQNHLAQGQNLISLYKALGGGWGGD